MARNTDGPEQLAGDARLQVDVLRIAQIGIFGATHTSGVDFEIDVEHVVLVSSRQSRNARLLRVEQRIRTGISYIIAIDHAVSYPDEEVIRGGKAARHNLSAQIIRYAITYGL